MIRSLQLTLSPEQAFDPQTLRTFLCEELGVDDEQLSGWHLQKRSIDARSRTIKVHVELEAFIDEPLPQQEHKWEVRDVSHQKPVLIIGAGPAGLFAALRLIELGKKPVILERGKDVQRRRRDIAVLNKERIVNPDSNYCFGEGGAGTYSDGKLYTRSHKRGDVMRMLEIFVAHGADETILADAHPHIDTNRLPNIITAIRESILRSGGEIHFDTRVTGFNVSGNRIKAVLTEQKGEQREFTAENILLATGHSARDIFELLHREKILIEAKPFAVGVRVEHPQSLIDMLQYHCGINELPARRKFLPAAPYNLVQQVNGKGVYSFCMCPGGIIAPCATAPGEVVTNGWSPSKRNNPFANSGIVVSVEPGELKDYSSAGPFAGLHFQQELEKKAWMAGGENLAAPAQALEDFVNRKVSAKLPPCSYIPGTTSFPLHELFPGWITQSLQEGFKAFGKKMKGYLSNDALIVAVESRTSSPVRIPRDREKLHHPQIVNLFPCGEGAGYAGGIVSAAMDGQKCADAIAGENSKS